MFRRFTPFLFEFAGLIMLLFSGLALKNKQKLVSVYFHNPPAKLFEKIIRHLQNRGYRFISSEELERIIESRHFDGKVAIITIDDGWKGNVQLTEIVRKYKVPVTIFITTSAIDEGNFWFEYILNRKDLKTAQKIREIIRIKKLPASEYYDKISMIKNEIMIERSALTRKELVELSQEELITIGSHTMTHICLPGKPTEIQKYEMLVAKETLENWTGKDVKYFSYPGGDYLPEQVEIAGSCGYSLCFTTNTSKVDIDNVSKFEVPRRSVNDDAGFFEAMAKVSGLWSRIKK